MGAGGLRDRQRDHSARHAHRRLLRELPHEQQPHRVAERGQHLLDPDLVAGGLREVGLPLAGGHVRNSTTGIEVRPSS
jgi:hypothetical protein